jgi:curved DNA-binding protein CbpA
MALLARGSVTDRPWGMTLGALGMRGLTGQLTLVSDGKTFRVAFEQGAVVAAHSPLVSDAAVRLALTSNLVNSTQVADITRRMAAAGDRDEIEVLAELARLTPDQAQRLGRRLVAQRAARTFSLDRADFTVDDAITLPITPGNELDIRAIIYMGAKSNLSEDRLAAELEMFGGWFQLKPDRMGELAQFGFTATEKPALQMLVGGANLADVEAALPDLGPRAIRAVVYALASCTACETGPALEAGGPSGVPRSVTGQPGSSGSTRAPAASRTATPPSAGASRPTPQPGSAGIPRSASDPGSSGGRRASSESGAARMPSSESGMGKMPRAPTGSDSRMRRASVPPPGSENWVPTRSPTIPPPVAAPSVRMNPPTNPPPVRTPSGSPAPAMRAPAPRRAKSNTAATQEIDLLLSNKVPLLDGGADHFTLLGVQRTATADEIQKTYFMLARKLHPDRLSAIGVADDARNAQRLMAQINAAFAVLNDPAKREEYSSILARGGEAAIRAEEARADDAAMKIMRAEEVFRQGEMALRRDQLPQAIDAFKQAVALQPNEAEYQALLAWATFASATDKNALAGPTRRALQKAIEANERSPTARYFLGRVERMLGKEKEALEHFKEVLRIKPNHSEAASEARILEQRLKGKR